MALTPLQKRRQQLLNGDVIAPAVPPPPKRNDPSIPTVYDPQWQFYIDLSQEQIAAYQAMPEWAAYCAAQPTVNYGADPVATAAALTEMSAKSWAVAAWGAQTLQTSLQTAQTAVQAKATLAAKVTP